MHLNRPLQSDSCTYPRASLAHAEGATVDRRYLTTREASAYCGFKTTGALRKALLEGRIRAAGRRGGTGTLMWEREELDRFLRGAPMGPPTMPAIAPPGSECPTATPALATKPASQPSELGFMANRGELRHEDRRVDRNLADEDVAVAAPPAPQAPARRGPGRPRKLATPGPIDGVLCATAATTPSAGPRGRTAAVIDAPQKPTELTPKESTAAALERIRMIGRPHLRRG